jgi:hypothetical protein
MRDDELPDPVGTSSASQALTELAAQHGLAGEEGRGMDDELWAYTMSVVSLCARIADASADAAGDARGGGDRIRAELLDYRIK